MESRSRKSSKRKLGSAKTEGKGKRPSSPKQERKAKKKDADVKNVQKTRWEPVQAVASAESAVQIDAPKKEEEQKSPQHHSRIKDLLQNKEKIVEYLFLTVTGTALQELIPDYLKNRPIEELKTLCETEIQKIPAEEILQIISGKYQPPDENAKPAVIKTEEIPALKGKCQPPDENVKPAVSKTKEISALKGKNPGKENPKKKTFAEKSSSIIPNPETIETFSNDVLELNPSSNEMKFITDEENQAPISIEEVAKELYATEKDAEIIELEMRARCIKALLKAKGEDSPDSDSKDLCEDE